VLHIGNRTPDQGPTVQLVIGNGIVPLLMGERLDLHPVAVILSLIFWDLLWGIIGMFLVVPIAAVIHILLGHLATTRPRAGLLAGRLPAAEAWGAFPATPHQRAEDLCLPGWPSAQQAQEAVH
jgi:hypothetical protein